MVSKRFLGGAAVFIWTLCGSASAGLVVLTQFSRIIAPIPMPNAEEILLATAHVTQGGRSTVSGDAEAQFVLSALAIDDTAQVSIGEGIYWGQDGNGVVEFFKGKDPSFGELASILSNGINDQVFISTRWRNGGTSGIVYQESLFFGRTQDTWSVPDLLGYDLSRVRLTVDDFHFDKITLPPGITTLEYDANLTYEFFGLSVPDVGTVWLLAVGAGIIACRRKQVRVDMGGLKRVVRCG